MKRKIYLIGSLRNRVVRLLGNTLRDEGHEVFDDWHGAGPRADDEWRKYEKARGRSYAEALKGYAAQHICQFDRTHLDRCNVGVMVMPAGKSCHLELGRVLGQRKPGYILFDKEPARWDVMYNLADGVFFQVADLIKELR